MMYGGGVDPYLELSKAGYLQSYKVNNQILKRYPPACMAFRSMTRNIAGMVQH
jgi:ABC-type Fe3+ transport system substrate-binding protein